MSGPSYYSLRQLSPYQGTVQVVRMDGFRAMSRDGVRWEVQLSTPGSRYATYATWRLKGAGRPAASERTVPFLEALDRHPPLPFPLADHLELWLLDAHQRLPLALLNSTLPQAGAPHAFEVQWQPAVIPHDRFVSRSLQGVAQPESPTVGYPHEEVLRRCIAAAAGPLPCAQWFLRDADGGGTGRGGCRLAPGLTGRHLAADAFPELLVRERGWQSERETELVRDYHHWQAANLLTHGGLGRETRARLERAAADHAERLYRLRRVLPDIVDRDLVNTLFVQAMITQTSADAAVAGG